MGRPALGDWCPPKEPRMPRPVDVAAWDPLAAEAFTGLREWRQQHPRATLAEIEAALDERLTRLRAQMLQDLALASAAADLRGAAERPACPDCGAPLQAVGQHERRLTTHGDRPLTLARSYARCPACGAGLFPPR
jgi:hypothetical protein